MWVFFSKRNLRFKHLKIQTNISDVLYCNFQMFNMDTSNPRFRLIKGLMNFKVIYTPSTMSSETRLVSKHPWTMSRSWRNFIASASRSTTNFISSTVRGWVFIRSARVTARGACFPMMKESLSQTSA